MSGLDDGRFPLPAAGGLADVDLDDSPGAEDSPDPQIMSRVPSDLGKPAVRPPLTPAAVQEASTGGIGSRLKKRAERAALLTERFEVPTTDEDDPVRLIVEAKVIRDQAELVRSAANDAKFVEASTVNVYWTEAKGKASELDEDDLHQFLGGWAEVGREMDLPPSWKAHRAVLAACESNPLLVGRLAGSILEWAQGSRDQLAAQLGT